MSVLRSAFPRTHSFGKLVPVFSRWSHNGCKDPSKQHSVMFLKKNRCIALWHPEQEFPYEHSLPLPDSLNDKSQVDAKTMTKHVNISWTPSAAKSELIKVFHTTKHTFRPRPKMNRAKTDTPIERKAL